MDAATANRMNFVQNEGGGGRYKDPPPIYRMPACRHCRFNCEPCLTIDEANEILRQDDTAPWKGNTLCQACHQKSNDSQNRWTYAKHGREFGEPRELDSDKLMAEIARLQETLRSMGVEV